MNKRFSTGISLAAAGLIAGLAMVSVPAFADSTAELIKKRQETMKQLGGNMKAIGEYVKTGQGSAADVARRAGEINAIAVKITELFPEGTGLDEVKEPKTGAKPEIWLDADGFSSSAKKLAELSASLQTSAGNGGKPEAIAAAFETLGKDGCGGCHKTFRLKLEDK